MTFRLFNKLNEVFKTGKEVLLRDYDDAGYHTVGNFSELSEIKEIDDSLEKYPNADLFVFDGDSYEELEY